MTPAQKALEEWYDKLTDAKLQTITWNNAWYAACAYQREADAKICDEAANNFRDTGRLDLEIEKHITKNLDRCAEAIRKSDALKPFEEWCFSEEYSQIENEGDPRLLIEGAWRARGKLDSGICEDLNEEFNRIYRDYPNNTPHQEGKANGAAVCADAIREVDL